MCDVGRSRGGGGGGVWKSTVYAGGDRDVVVELLRVELGVDVFTRAVFVFEENVHRTGVGAEHDGDGTGAGGVGQGEGRVVRGVRETIGRAPTDARGGGARSEGTRGERGVDDDERREFV